MLSLPQSAFIKVTWEIRGLWKRKLCLRHWDFTEIKEVIWQYTSALVVFSCRAFRTGSKSGRFLIVCFGLSDGKEIDKLMEMLVSLSWISP